MDAFDYTTAAQRVVFEPGALARLGETVGAFGWRRLMLCTSPHFASDGTVDRVREALGDRLVATYTETASHVPDHQVEVARTRAEAAEVDAVIGLGGGSPIGMAKALALELEALRTGRDEATSAHPGDPPLVPNVAIPTTYAGSEMTPVYGVTRRQPDGSTRKVTVRDGKVTPTLTLYDPELTLSLPPGLTASTGINALAHCIEAVYSATRNPLSTAAALRGIALISDALPRCHADGADLDARTAMLAGAHLGGVSLATVKMGIHHGTGHVLGGVAGVPHGVANAIVLPHAVRFNADALAPQLALVAEEFGIDRAGRSDEAVALALSDRLHEWIADLGQPQTLREAGVDLDLLPQMAEAMQHSKSVAANPKALSSTEALPYLEAMI